MPPGQLVPFATSCLGGINQNKDNCDPGEQCQDALNVWAPDGIVKRRPGSVGLLPFFETTSLITVGTGYVVVENPAGVFAVLGTDNLNNLPVGARIYFGSSDKTAVFLGIGTIFAGSWNTNNSVARAEYWNGSVWRGLKTTMVDLHYLSGAAYPNLPTELSRNPFFLHPPSGDSTDSHALLLVPPTDWADSTSVNVALAGYFVRCTVSEFAFSAAVPTTGTVPGTSGPNARNVGLVMSLMPSGKVIQSVAAISPVAGQPQRFGVVGIQGGVDPLGQFFISLFPDTTTGGNTRASFAPVLSTGEIFTALNKGPVLYTNYSQIVAGQTLSATALGYAQVETASFAVGPGAPYDPTVIALNQSWPAAKFITFANNQLWVATDSVLQWSAPVPYHKVWPQLAFEYIQGDNSPTTALTSFNSRIYIGKLESLYATVYTQTDAFGVDHYSVQKVVSGVGPVSNNAITEVENRLVFLGEQDLYAVDTAGNLDVLSDWVRPTPGVAATGVPPVCRLSKFWSTINPAARQGAAAINWKTQRVYLLSVPTGTSQINDTTVVWDYAHDTFWFWKGFNAQYWVKDINEYGDETLYFGDANGNIFQFGVGDTDNGAAIDSYVISEPLGYKQGLDFQLRRVEIEGRNATGQASVSIYKNDNLSVPIKTGTVDFSAWQDGGWSGGGLAQPTRWATNAAKANPTVNWNGSGWCANTSRRRFKTYDLACHNFAVKVESTQKGVDFRIGKIEAQTLPIAASFVRRSSK